jgi:ubiquinone/menaquinone biosynthesis C-methylase UbiE
VDDDTIAGVFDDLAPHYDDDHHERIADRMVAGLPADASPSLVLDIACGSGAAAFAAVRALAPERVVAVDLSARMVERAKDRALTRDPGGVVDWRVGDAVPAPVPDGSADLVLCASSLHFLGARALADWRRALRPGGHLAFTLPSADTFRPSGAFRALVAADLPLPGTEEEAAALTREAGFTGARAELVPTSTERPRSVLVVHARAPRR